MAYKGTAAKSTTGASMSKYDVEVEGRLQALEAANKKIEILESEIVWMKSKVGDLTETGKTGPDAELEQRFNLLLDILKANEKNGIEKLSKGRL
jgi:hypothetical protein|tara:strand:- start:372 stop:653 length:282 start_codon:yes stop_codon:yes gene_type:complete